MEIAMKIRTLPLACAVIATLAACERGREPDVAQPSDEMSWARAALERNPNLEVIAEDADAGMFTVRDRASGDVQAVKAADLAAAPVSALAAAPPSAEPAETEPAPVAEPPPAEDEAAASAEPSEAPAEADPLAAYTIERQGGQVRVSGPGVSIVSAGTPASTASRAEPAQRPSDPYICEGQRMIQFDNRRISVQGDAIIARDGCELHITNSRVVASGTGVVVRDATVHITNSYVEGASGSYDAGPGARVFLRGVTLKGAIRRDMTAKVQELPGGSPPP
jgi:hypothetical protein